MYLFSCSPISISVILTNASCVAEGSVTSVAKRKGSHDDNSRSDKKLRYSGPSLPEVRR